MIMRKQNILIKLFILWGTGYGCGMAAYLASVRECKHLFLASGYRTNADLYNKIIPVFWGPNKVFIKNNIRVDKYAKITTCPVTVIGSDSDKTLSAKLQKKNSLPVIQIQNVRYSPELSMKIIILLMKLLTL